MIGKVQSSRFVLRFWIRLTPVFKETPIGHFCLLSRLDNNILLRAKNCVLFFLTWLHLSLQRPKLQKKPALMLWWWSGLETWSWQMRRGAIITSLPPLANFSLQDMLNKVRRRMTSWWPLLLFCPHLFCNSSVLLFWGFFLPHWWVTRDWRCCWDCWQSMGLIMKFQSLKVAHYPVLSGCFSHQ